MDGVWWQVKTGRCANGAERDRGRIAHAVVCRGVSGPTFQAALCGAVPGRLSSGWSDYGGMAAALQRCPRCARILTPFGRRAASSKGEK